MSWWQAQHLIEQQEFEERLCRMEREVEQGRKILRKNALKKLIETEKVTEHEHKRSDI